MKTSAAVLLVVLAGLVVGSSSACRRSARPGGPCHVPDQLVCAGTDRALVCDSGVWVEVPCRGRRGCSRRSEADECDDTIAAAGDPCPTNPAVDYACTADARRALVCKSGRFRAWRDCRGPDRCDIHDGHNVHCDTTFGEPGDPCSSQGAYSCAVDRTSMLVCDGTALAPATTCRGPEGCRVQRDAHTVDCDDTLALEGDVCDRPKRIACSVDRKGVLVCEAGKYGKRRECRRSDCRLEGTLLFCD